MPTELALDTSIVISAGTLITLVVSIIKYSSKVTSFKKEIELKIKEHDARLEKIDKLDLDSRLTRMQTDLDWIKAQFIEIRKKK